MTIYAIFRTVWDCEHPEFIEAWERMDKAEIHAGARNLTARDGEHFFVKPITVKGEKR
jgi:hypothetical protein